jgi:hypothetical protein
MPKYVALLMGLSFAAVSATALAEQPSVLGDIVAQHAKKLSKEELEKLLPGAKMSRKARTGSTNIWTNEPSGTFVVSTDNRGRIGSSSVVGSSTAPGKWHISPDGRYCVTIEWKRVPTEDWCRYVFQTADGYYTSKSDKNRGEKVYRVEIGAK